MTAYDEPRNPEGTVTATDTDRAVWGAMPPGEWLDCATISERADMAYSTTHTALGRLVENEHVEREEFGNAVVYRRPEGADGP